MDYQYSVFCVCVLLLLFSSDAVTNGICNKSVSSKVHSNLTNKSNNRAIQRKSKNALKVPMNLDFDSFLANDGQDPNYPFDEIERFFKEQPELKLFFKPVLPQIGNRGGWTNDNDENLCSTRRITKYAPQVMRNAQGVRKTIINHGDVIQDITIEYCNSPNQSDYRCSNIRLGHKSICRQNFMTVKLITFDSTLGYDTFSVPSCCSCVLVEP